MSQQKKRLSFTRKAPRVKLLYMSGVVDLGSHADLLHILQLGSRLLIFFLFGCGDGGQTGRNMHVSCPKEQDAMRRGS